MTTVDKLAALLPERSAAMAKELAGQLTEVRLRAGRAICFAAGHDSAAGDTLGADALVRVLSALMEYSVYARQDELDRGFFTMPDGSRVGVCGRMYPDGGRMRMAEIGSACIRISRELPGCADGIIDVIDGVDGIVSAMLVSPPGMGKTTMLRDIARQLSGRGKNVCVADERRELAACHLGVPTLDVGPRTDVMDSCPRTEAVVRMLRSMAPDVIIADEIGSKEDARALADAARCGIAVVASAHAADLEDILRRPCLASVLESGVMDRVILLGPRPGVVKAVWKRERGRGETSWTRV